MALTPRLVFLLIALICFLLATFGATVPRVNLTAAGLAILTAAFLFT